MQIASSINQAVGIEIAIQFAFILGDSVNNKSDDIHVGRQTRPNENVMRFHTGFHSPLIKITY